MVLLYDPMYRSFVNEIYVQDYTSAWWKSVLFGREK